MTGTKAYEVGLVDGLGGVGDAVENASELAGIKDANVIWSESGKIFGGFFPGITERNLLNLNTDTSSTDVKNKYELIRKLPGVEFRYQINL